MPLVLEIVLRCPAWFADSGQRTPKHLHAISIWHPFRQNRPVRPLSIRAHVSKTLRLEGLPQRCLPNFLPPAYRRSSRDKKVRPHRPPLKLRAKAAAPATG